MSYKRITRTIVNGKVTEEVIETVHGDHPNDKEDSGWKLMDSAFEKMEHAFGIMEKAFDRIFK